jgi:hypothetical protein
MMLKEMNRSHLGFSESQMKTKSKNIASRLGALMAAVTLVVGAAACGEPVGDIDRTQPNRVAKTVFDGEWWSRATVVDKQFHTTFPFIGFEDGMERIRWEITQTRLIAYRSYERTPGSGSGNDVGDQHAVAVFPIMMHFDVTRAYNPVNGVEQNILIENMFDRPWWERDFIRVNWSRNLVDDWTIAGFVQSLSPMKVTRNANSDPSNPWKVRFEDSDPEIDGIDYFETTIESILQPNFWACYLVGDWYNNCEGADARVKYSFRKIPADQNQRYEPLNYPDFETMTFGTLVTQDPLTGNQANVLDGNGNALPCLATDDLEPGQQCLDPEEVWVASTPEGTFFCDPNVHDPDDCQPFSLNIFSRFGFFRNDRFLLDRENGFTLTARERLINRWNIWERAYDDDGDVIPMAEREVRPIVYHTNVHLPPSMMPAVQAMAEDWNLAFKDTVANLRGVDISEVPEDVYVVLENDCNLANVDQYIEDNADLHDFHTDLMAHNITSIGYGNLENACAVLEHYSKELNNGYDSATPDEEKVPVFTWQQLGDLRYSMVNWAPKAELSGPLGYGPSATDPLTGEIVSANANIYGASLDRYANYGADIVDLLNGRITEGDVINGTHIREYIGDVRARYSNKLSDDVTNRYIQMAHDRTDHLTDDQYFVQMPPTAFNENIDLIAETGFEEEFLMNTDTLMLFGGPEAAEAAVTGTQIPEELLNMAKPSTWSRMQIPAQALSTRPGGDYLENFDNPFDKMSALERFQRRQDFFGRMNACYDAAQVEPAVADLAVRLQDLPREEVVLKIREGILRAVLAHEVGHTIGLRHNFEGSADAKNFFPQFWGVDLGADDIRMSNASSDPEELQYSTIMDYHQRFNSDFGGIGMYDRAAVQFGYGELIEVFDEGRWDPDFRLYEDAFLPEGWDQNMDLFYGDDIPYLLSGDPDVGQKIDDHFEEVSDRFFDGDTSAYMDIQTLGIEPRPQNIFKRKHIPFKEFKRHELYRIFGNVNPDGSPPSLATDYLYCSDVYAWGGSLTCNRWDRGYSSELIVNNAAEMYEFYYPFTAFRGARTWEMNPAGGYMGRLYSRTYQPMLNAFRFFFFFQRSSSTVFPLVRDWAKASFVGANFFGRVLQTPEPGSYCLSDDQEWYVPEAEATSCSDSIDIGLGDSRFYDSAYTNEFQFRPQNVGHMFDKVLALQAMTSNNAFFFRDFSNFLSRGAFSIGYYRLFQPEVLRLYNGFIEGDREAYAAKVSVVDGKPEIAFDTFLDFQGEFPAAQGTKIKPSDSYVLRYFAMFYAMANLTSQMDSSLDYAQRSRITLVGSQNDPTVDPTVVPDQIVFTDPQTNFMYKATAPDNPELSLGFILLNGAQDFVDDSWQPAKDAVDAARQALADEETAGGDTSDEIAAVEAAEDALAPLSRQLNEKMQIIEQVRQLSDILEYSR